MSTYPREEKTVPVSYTTVYLCKHKNNLTFVKRICHKDLTLNKAMNTSYSCQVLDLDISLFHGRFNTHIYVKKRRFALSIVNFPFLAFDLII